MNLQTPQFTGATSAFAVDPRGQWSRIVRRVPLIALAIIPAIFLGFVIIGAVRWYSPVPFWDMWDDYIHTYVYWLDGERLLYLFEEANEHRIVASKLLFLTDLRFFGGESRLLIPGNVVFLTLVWLTFCAMARRLFAGRKDLWLVVCFGLAAPCLSWLQEPNITWGYQSPFFFAYLFPLIAFACLAMAAGGSRAAWWFAAAIAAGVASFGTMANGVMALPLMIVMLLLLGRPQWRRATLLLGIGAVCTVAWFHGYNVVPREKPDVATFITFVLTFFGGPFIRIYNNIWVGYTIGLAFIVAAIVSAVFVIHRRANIDPMILALVVFIAYIGVTAAMIGYGRAADTPNAGHVLRYATPALEAWAALALVIAFAFRDGARAKQIYGAAGLVATLVLLPSQWAVFRDSGPQVAVNRTLAGLALVMNITDAQAFANIYPADTPANVAHLKAMADLARERHFSIFADPRFVDAAAALGRPADAGFHPCRSGLNLVAPIAGNDTTAHATGWVYDTTKRDRIPQFVFFAEDGLIVGVGVTGVPRPDVAKAYGRSARYGGFEGYVAHAVAAESEKNLSIVCADRKS